LSFGFNFFTFLKVITTQILAHLAASMFAHSATGTDDVEGKKIQKIINQ